MTPAGDDDDLFRRAMRDVKPLEPERRRKTAETPRPAKKPDARPQPDPGDTPPVRSAAGRWPADPAHISNGPTVDRRPGSAPGVDARTMGRLKRGRLRPEARLDLHGMTQAEAHGALRRFVLDRQGRGKRCVLVITGKGSITTGGVLRTQVPRWLDTPPLADAVLAYAEAIPPDGGSGALYVLLRRNRDR